MNIDQVSLFPASTLEELEDEGSQVKPASISNISIEQLFGRYSYSIPASGSNELPGTFNRLLLLYGDNGSGKTTILRLVYHLVSPEPRKGHRSFIARTPFTRLVVRFGNGLSITVSRPAGMLRGSFSVTITQQGVALEDLKFEANERFIIPRDRDATPEQLWAQERLAFYLKPLKLTPYYLTDDRSIDSDALEDEDDERLELSRREMELYYARRYREGTFPRELRPGELRRSRELTAVVSRTEGWLRQQAIRGTDTGSASSNNLYLDVLRRIATSAIPSSDGRSLSHRLEDLHRRTAEYAQFGLSTTLPAREFEDILAQVPRGRSEVFSDVLVPYLDGIQARLDALKDLQELLVTFTSSVNSFLADKELRFSVRQGISIVTSDGDELAPLALSSGERQLLLLLCSILVARDDTRLFIIDEPEISLNVKWQRQLLDALLACTTGTNMQFLVATHSVEMVAGHRESLAKLVDERGRAE